MDDMEKILRSDFKDAYLQRYKQYIDQFTNTTSTQTKNMCICELEKIRTEWSLRLHFNIKELNDITPHDIIEYYNKGETIC